MRPGASPFEALPFDPSEAVRMTLAVWRESRIDTLCGVEYAPAGGLKVGVGTVERTKFAVQPELAVSVKDGVGLPEQFALPLIPLQLVKT